MNEFEILVPLTAILIGGATVLIPIAGLTARFALKPVVEAFARMKELQGADRQVELLERRVALLEEQVHGLERDNARLVEESEFRRQLGTPAGS